jgi:hypothetical protein
VEYALIDYDNGVWKAQGLDDFEFRSEERGTDGPPLDRLRGRVQLAAREKHQTDKIVTIRYVFTNHAHRHYRRLLEEHHARQT